MAEIENQTVKSYRDQLRDRMTTMYPGRNFAGEMGANGESGVNGGNAEEELDQAILETLDSLVANRDETASKNKALVDLFYGDPLSVEFVQKWIATGDPRTALVETFGDDLADLATEEGRGRFPEALKSWRDRKAENDRMNQEAEANWNNTIAELDAWGNEKGLSDDEKVATIIKLVDIVAKGITNIYDRDAFEAVYKLMNYDTAISNARQEGEVAGRNARIDENRRRRQSVSMMPPTLNGQGTPAEEKRPAAPSSVWSGIK